MPPQKGDLDTLSKYFKYLMYVYLSPTGQTISELDLYSNLECVFIAVVMLNMGGPSTVSLLTWLFCASSSILVLGSRDT
jgi:hypothetical protein